MEAKDVKHFAEFDVRQISEHIAELFNGFNLEYFVNIKTKLSVLALSVRHNSTGNAGLFFGNLIYVAADCLDSMALYICELLSWIQMRDGEKKIKCLDKKMRKKYPEGPPEAAYISEMSALLRTTAYNFVTQKPLEGSTNKWFADVAADYMVSASCVMNLSILWVDILFKCILNEEDI